MNYAIKFILLSWLAFCFICIQFGIGLVFVLLLMSENLSFMSCVGPVVGITNMICIITLMVRVVKSNPVGWICGKAKIQREEDSSDT